MQALSPLPRTRVQLYRLTTPSSDMQREIEQGLLATPRRIHPKYFYDERGSLLFDQITEQLEYYATRAETEILRRYGAAISARLGANAILIEPGSGTSAKAEQLLPTLQPRVYVPIDIAAIHVRDAACRISHRFPWLDIQALVTDICTMEQLPDFIPAGRRVIFYPGSSIGNFEPAAAVALLSRWREFAGTDGHLLIGVDLIKDPGILHDAYNDERGITAEFNLNILRHLNRVAAANFDLNAFRHVAFFNEPKHRVEMHLESLCDQHVRVGSINITLRDGERIHTENSYKYSDRSFAALAEQAGWELDCSWHDHGHFFGVLLFRAR
ncbi:MAG: L-histidine N(alpha)-methyltransferase [Spongiibacteraceae bacterium]|jgi:dimethylhistidine N-methyltransferase|nr:L-histidine N(alpha)-methyltransferase [Spongiibacteraceae bacterium]